MAGCGSSPAPPASTFSGQCTIAADGGSLAFAPARGEVGPAFVIRGAHAAGDYDAEVNAVDAAGRYGPDARGTVHLDASERDGTLNTPDLATAAGDTVRYVGSWRCATVLSSSPVPEPGGGPSAPR